MDDKSRTGLALMDVTKWGTYESDVYFGVALTEAAVWCIATSLCIQRYALSRIAEERHLCGCRWVSLRTVVWLAGLSVCKCHRIALPSHAPA